MNSNEDSPTTYKTIDELAEALCDDSLDYGNIIRAIDLSFKELNQFSSWSSESYTRNCILDCESFELILLCWEKGQITPIHDHGGEECWVRVVKGNFKETIYKTDDNGKIHPVKTTLSQVGDISYMKDFMGFHSLQNMNNSRSMSLHLYAKPIRTCRLFDDETQTFVRKELVYDTISDDATIINL